MHKSQLAGCIIDCQIDDVDQAAAFWSKALGLTALTDARANERCEQTMYGAINAALY